MKEKDQYFRANAGIVLLNEREEVLALERKKIPELGNFHREASELMRSRWRPQYES